MTEDVFSDETQIHLKEGVRSWKELKEKFMKLAKP